MLCTIVICYVTQKANALQWGCDGCDEVTFSLQCSPRVVGWVTVDSAVQGAQTQACIRASEGRLTWYWEEDLYLPYCYPLT